MNPLKDEDARHNIFLLFGTFLRSMLTMMSFVFGDWYDTTVYLVDEVSEWWVFPCVFHQFLVGFAVISVLQGVFINETFEAADKDNEVMVRRAKEQNKHHKKKMDMLFKKADKNGDGNLSLEELKAILYEDDILSWLGSMGLDVDDVDKIWQLIDNGDNRLCAEELTDGVAKLMGQAKSMDLFKLMRDFEDFQVQFFGHPGLSRGASRRSTGDRGQDPAVQSSAFWI